MVDSGNTVERNTIELAFQLLEPDHKQVAPKQIIYQEVIRTKKKNKAH